MKKTKKLLSLLSATLLLAFSLVACSSKSSDNATDSAATEASTQAENTDNKENPYEGTTVKIGVVGEQNEHWEPVIASLAKEGITVELVKFADYTLPNQALADGEIDLNAFQHYAFLESEVKDKGLKLSAIGESIIAPLGLFSDKIKDISEIKDGDKIAIPNDATNGGRALKLLETAGLIKVDPAVGFVPTVNDITENKLNLEFYEVEAANTPSLLPDVAAAVINGGFAVDAGLSPQKDAIYLETVAEGSDNPYINIIVARTEDKDNELYKKVVDAFRTPEVAKVIEEVYKGAFLPTWK